MLDLEQTINSSTMENILDTIDNCTEELAETFGDSGKLIGAAKKLNSKVNLFRIKSFLNGILMYKYNNNLQKLKYDVEVYGHKEELLLYIDKQTQSQHNKGNVICGIIVAEALSENRRLTPEEVNHIDFLREMNENDFKNYINIYENQKNAESNSDNEYRGPFIDQENPEASKYPLLKTTFSKMDKYGYVNPRLLVNGGKELIVSELSELLMEKYILPYPALVELLRTL